MPHLADSANTPYFMPETADELWKLATTPHPVVGQARHLGEALIHAKMIEAAVLAECLELQQEERSQGRWRAIGQLLIENGALTPDQL